MAQIPYPDEAATLEALQLLSDLHAALDAADAMGMARVGLRLEQAIDALADQPGPLSPSPSPCPSPSPSLTAT